MEKIVDYIEINPIIALDKDNQPTTYNEAVAFEPTDEDDINIVAWGVYKHFKDAGLECVFDVVDKYNAELAQKLLIKMYNITGS